MEPLSTAPTATYRVQLNAAFGFGALEEILPYLKQLGITHIYFSPILHARPGSTHGYDISNHGELNPELGTDEEFESLMLRMRALGLRQIFDMVPNHMGILGNENIWWNDVLENGPASTYAQYFDIDWNFSLKLELHDKVLLPILGCSYGEALESGELQLRLNDGRFEVSYFDHLFPLCPGTIELVLTQRLPQLEAGSEDDSEYQSILTAVRNLPRRSDQDPERILERYREKEVIRRRLSQLMAKAPSVRQAVEQAINDINGKPGNAASFDLFDKLLDAQAYRLSHFRVAGDEINYRRFFDVNELASLRMERREVFDDTHAFLIELLQKDYVHGIRVDHIDGLYNPKQYLEWLQATANAHRPHADELYLLAEKIICVGEELPLDWATHGTTGYELLADVNWAFIDTSNQKEFTRLYSDWTDEPLPYSEVVFRSKKQVAYLSLSSELHVLAKHLDVLSERDRRHRDFTFSAILEALRDIIACFPVYRTYLDDSGFSEADRRYIALAVSRAKRRNPGVHFSLFQFIQDTLLLAGELAADNPTRIARAEFVKKFQQVTAPVMAKGAEDTAFYRYNRLLSLCEVGSDPGVFGQTSDVFHAKMKARQKNFPYALSASSTHDTKRGEDTRARLNVLSEMPRELEAHLQECEKTSLTFVTDSDDARFPDRNTRYFIYQTLLGTWPANRSATDWDEYQERIQNYLQKAIHEAKVFTSWTNPDELYDNAVRKFLDGILGPTNVEFLATMDAFVNRIAPFGFFNSLSQLTLKMFLPGVPDFYQGSEFWDFSLVDPDNRRSVDFSQRAKCLASFDPENNSFGEHTSADTKLRITAAGLRYRTANSELFRIGEYIPIELSGEYSRNVLAFARTSPSDACVVVVSRFLSTIAAPGTPPLGGLWEDTKLNLGNDLAAGAYTSLFTGERINASAQVSLQDVFRTLPFAVLTR